MRRQVLVAILLAGMVALAGCSGGPTTPTTTQNGTDDPTQGTTVALPSDLPSGVNASGLQNASALFDAHVASLTDTTYRFAADATFSTGNRTQASHITAAAGNEHTYVRQNSSGVTVETWTTGDYSLRKQQSEGTTRYVVTQGAATRGQLDPTTLQRTVFSTYLQFGDYDSATGVTRDGQRYVKLTADTANASAQVDGNVTALDSTLLVTPDGRIASFTFSMTVDGSSGETTLDLTYDLEAVGSVSPEQPSWTDSVPHVTAEVVGEGDVLAVRNTGGTAVPENATFLVAANGSYDRVRLANGLDAGDTVYVTATNDGGFDATVHASEPSSGGVDFAGSSRVLVRGQFGNTLVQLVPGN